MKILFALIVIWIGSANAEFQVPALTGPVVDLANFISRDLESEIEKELKLLNELSGAQIQVVTIDSLDGLSIEQASIKIVEAWKIGDSHRDDGVLLLVSKKDRKIRIEVGQGLEGILPDVIAKRIIENIILPEFKKGNFDRGIVLGVSSILEVVRPEYEGKLHRAPSGLKAKDVIVWLFLLLFFAFGFIGRLSGGGNFSRGRYYGAGYGSGGGGWSGGGGSSWSGGGGGFSGGGASGGW